MFNNILYKLKHGMAMVLSLGPTMTNVFLSFYELKWLEQHRSELKTVFHRIYVDDIFVLFKSAKHLTKFRAYLNICHPYMSFFI